MVSAWESSSWHKLYVLYAAQKDISPHSPELHQETVLVKCTQDLNGPVWVVSVLTSDNCSVLEVGVFMSSH